jgi:hypothetical protein
MLISEAVSARWVSVREMEREEVAIFQSRKTRDFLYNGLTHYSVIALYPEGCV